jgi:multisubunit Na+/H+ antiporter MnhE subunit
VLFLLWLALQRSTSSGQLLLGLSLALSVPLATATLRPTRVRVRRPLVAVRFVLMVCYDVLISNFKIARSVIACRWRKPRAGFVVIPLELSDPLGLAGLAMVTTIVPGTVWSELALRAPGWAQRRALARHRSAHLRGRAGRNAPGRGGHRARAPRPGAGGAGQRRRERQAVLAQSGPSASTRATRV